MNWPRLNRKVHYWIAFVASIPILVIICSGLLLQLKKESDWIQPHEHRRPSKEPTISFETILKSCQSVPEAQINSWDDVHRVDVRPSKGVIKVTAKNSYEVQLDQQTGEVLQVAYRRSDTIEQIHDGSWFDDAVKLWVFLPAAILLLVLWFTGMYLFVLPYWVRFRKRR